MSEVKRFCVEHSDLAECFQGSAPEATDLVFYSDFDRVTAERDALKKELDGQPDITVINCVFEGENEDGSQVMVFEGDEIKALKSFHMNGWMCIGPEQYDALQQRLTAADERVDVLEGLLRDVYNQNELSLADNQRIDAALKPADGHPCPVSLDGCDGSCAP